MKNWIINEQTNERMNALEDDDDDEDDDMDDDDAEKR